MVHRPAPPVCSVSGLIADVVLSQVVALGLPNPPDGWLASCRPWYAWMLLLLFAVLSPLASTPPVSLASALPRMLVVVVVLLLSQRCPSAALSRLSRAPLALRVPSVAVAAALHSAWPSSSPGGVSTPTGLLLRRPAHPPPVAWLAPSVVVVLVGAADGFLTLVSLVLLQSAASCRQLVPRAPASGSFSSALHCGWASLFRSWLRGLCF